MILRATACLLWLALSASGSTYYVSPTGNNGNAGTSSGSPWATVYFALNTVGNGDTVIQMPGAIGEYVHNLQMTANSVTLTGQPGSRIEGSGLFISGSNCTIAGITISNYVSSAHMLGGVVLGSRAHGTVIRDCTMKDFVIDQSQYGVVWYPDPAFFGALTNCTPSSCAANCLVSNCFFTNFMGAECIRVGGSNNLIVNNTIAYQMNGDIFQFFGCSNIIRGNFITNCFYRLDIGGGQHADMFQTYGQDGNTPSAGDPYFDSYGNLAENNQFWDCKISFGQMTEDKYGNGAAVERVADFTERNNLFVRCGGQDAFGGGTGGSISSIGIAYFRAINNTYVSCFKDTNAGGYITDLVIHTFTNNVGGYLGQSTNSVIVNNAFIDCGYGTNVSFIGIESGFGFDTNNWNITIKSNYSSWFGAGPNWTKVNNQWQINIKGLPSDNDTYAPPPDINNGDDPKLVSFARQGFAGHLRPVLGSPLIDAGTNATLWGINTDSELVARPLGARHDIGSYEFDPNLLMHFDFDEAPAVSNRVYDVTGYGHDAVKMDSTNFAQSAVSVNGTLSSYGTVVSQVPDNSYNYSWYGAITNLGGSGAINFITNGTFAAWVQMATNGERFDSVIDTGEPPSAALTPSSATNSFNIGYGYSDLREPTVTQMVFKVYGNTIANDLHNPSLMLGWPQLLRDGATWGHLAVTWTGGGNAILYFNGQPTLTNALGVPWLRVSSSPSVPWVGLNIQTHGGTPQWADSDIYPNYGALKGKLDEVRLYNRVLDPVEVLNLYAVTSVPSSQSQGGSTTISGRVSFSGGVRLQ